VDPIAQHYGSPGVLDRIFAGLQAQGLDLDTLTPVDIAPIDEFHIRGRQATLDLVELVEAQAGMQVLDAGSGLGGPARTFAHERACEVTGLDLTPEFCNVAAELSRRLGLDGRTRFCCGTVLAMPFPNATFDIATTQHVQMNIEDKPGFYSEVRRVLKPGGRFVFHDILAGPGGAPKFPVHWAETPEMSFLADAQQLRLIVENAGFRVLTWEDTTELSRNWYLALMELRRKAGPTKLGLHLLLGPAAKLKFDNMAVNLNERRVAVCRGLLTTA
jgi:SAM-dependent methyltransferase